MSTLKARVVVIGGGVAGLSAATSLRKHGGFDVTLLEADSRIGGRVKSAALGDHFIEHGAQWVHGNDNNSVFIKATSHGLLDTGGNNLKFSAHSVYVDQNGEVIPEKPTLKVLRNALRKLSSGPSSKNSLPDEPLGKWSERAFWEYDDVIKELNAEDVVLAEKIFDWQHRFQTSIDGSDSWYLPSCKGQQEYWECPGNPLNSWKPPACYESFLGVILHNKPSFAPDFAPELPDWIHLEKEVCLVNYNKPEVEIRCKDGASYTCDHVICTVSLGVLKERHSSLFSPSLPSKKVNAIEHLAIGCVNKLHFDFGSHWWPKNIIGFNLLWNALPSDYPKYFDPNISEQELCQVVDGFPVWCRCILGFYVVSSHPTALNSWITGPAARLIEKLDETTVQETFMNVLRKFVGKTADVPEPKRFLRSTWYTNPFTRGSYSFRSVESERNDVWSTDIAEPLVVHDKPVVCFAGEASHVHFYSTVHGAHDSGLREAQRLINFVDKKDIQVSQYFPFTEGMFKGWDEDKSDTEESD